MKANKKVSTLIAASMLISSTSVIGAETINRELIGKDRIETAVKISKDGWSSTETVVLVNDSAIADALTATPLAYAKNAPILLTSKKSLSYRTKEEIKRLKAKNIILIGGKSVLPKSVEDELIKLGLKVDRIEGNTREETALAIAKRLDGIKDISEIAVVNGTTGLADAVSISAVAAERNMPILLANPKSSLSVSEKFINGEDIKSSFIIGGKVVLPEKIISELPEKHRIEGNNRNETNAKVIEKFYVNKELDNLYLAKDGMSDQGQLIDALSVGVLAAKNGVPVLIASKKLSESQINVINTKKINTITQVGGNGNEKAFSELKEIEKEVVYEVDTIEEFNEALNKSNANDIIVVKPSTTVSNDVNISTDKAVEIKLHGDYIGMVTINTPNAEIINKGNVSELEIKNAKNTIIKNSSSGKINDLVVDSSSKNVFIENNGIITNVENNALDTKIQNNGTISKPVTGANSPIIEGNKPEGGSLSSGGNVVTPSISIYKVKAEVYRNDIKAFADISYAGNNKAKVEIIGKDGISVAQKENVDIINGKIECKFENIAHGEYKIKVSVDGYSNISEIIVINNQLFEVLDEKTLKDALKNAKSGDTIKLSNNIENENMEVKDSIIFNKDITLDLNGNTITHTGNTSRDVMQITTSDINVDIRNGIFRTDDKTTNANHLGLILDKCRNVVVNMNNIDIIMSGYINNANYDVITVNGGCEKITLNLNGCHLSGAGDGIYFPAGGVGENASRLNINDTIIDNVKMGVAIKGGIVSINDTKIKSEGIAYTINETADEILRRVGPKSSGYTASGEALIIECNYKDRGIDVTVDGNCEFESKNGYAIRMQFFEGELPKKLTVNGGNFKGYIGGIYTNHIQNNVYGKNDSKRFAEWVKINGGTFTPHIDERNNLIKDK